MQVRDEGHYRVITHDFAVAAARAVKAGRSVRRVSFISGQGTGFNSRFMWARVRAETERDVMAVAGAICWRPSAIDGEPSPTVTWYSPFRPLFRLLSPFRSLYISGADLGHAMLQATEDGMRGRILENAEIRDVADRRNSATGSAL